MKIKTYFNSQTTNPRELESVIKKMIENLAHWKLEILGIYHAETPPYTISIITKQVTSVQIIVTSYLCIRESSDSTGSYDDEI